MAINKAELVHRLTEQQRKETDAFETLIDNRLKADYAGERICVEIKNFLHPKVRREIERRFSQAGWKIKFESDQREGDWVELF